jgi:hypothetical protein
MSLRNSEPRLAGHHDVHNEEIEDEPVEELPRFASRPDIGYPEPAFLEEAP